MKARSAGPIILLAALLVGCHHSPHPSADAGRRPPDQAALKPYLVQLHIHGHSNHNGNPLPASIESHTAEAARHGFDVIWWSDHAELFDAFEDVRIAFGDATLAASGDTVLLGMRQGRQVSKLVVERSGPFCEVALAGGGLAARVVCPSDELQWGRLALEPASRLGTVRTIQFCRPVASGLRLDAWLGAEGLGGDSYLRLDFDLSWHPRGRHRLRFEGVTAGPAAPVRLDDSTVVGQFVVPAAVGLVSLDVEGAAALLAEGLDNTLSGFRLEIGAREGAAVSARIDSLVLRSARPGGENQFATVGRFAARHAEALGVASHVGVEVGHIHLPRMPHMNAYLPEAPESPDDFLLDLIPSREQWIAEIHRRGGLVSFNHPFGASRNPRSRWQPEPEAYDDAPTKEPPRVLEAAGAGASEDEFWDIAGPLLELRALGADLLEVGYLFRGTGSLRDHLRLWDLALANGIHLVGNGTSDSHGGVWGPDMIPSPFASWVWARSTSAADLIDGMRRGHVAFGDPFSWTGDFGFFASPTGPGGAVGGGGSGGAAMMGDTLLVDWGSAVESWTEIVPVREDIEVTQVRVKIRPGREVSARRTVAGGQPGKDAVNHEGGGLYRFRTVVDDSCYVRLEVRASDGRPLVFSNPIYLFPGR